MSPWFKGVVEVQITLRHYKVKLSGTNRSKVGAGVGVENRGGSTRGPVVALNRGGSGEQLPISSSLLRSSSNSYPNSSSLSIAVESGEGICQASGEGTATACNRAMQSLLLVDTSHLLIFDGEAR